ncbi:MAG: hypothetical protein M0Z55_10470 [Peptococcaceae bacterium]|nr:hypothetical protein [Peptococcaceae bacterium]
MKSNARRRLFVHILRLLMIGILAVILLPRLFMAFVDLYNVMLQHNKVPSGNPLQVEAPLLDRDNLQ